jgi:hypothetical protein
MATTWLDWAAALECLGGEVTGRQDGRDSMAASASSGVETRRCSSVRQRREERKLTSGPGVRRLTSGPGVLFKI